MSKAVRNLGGQLSLKFEKEELVNDDCNQLRKKEEKDKWSVCVESDKSSLSLLILSLLLTHQNKPKQEVTVGTTAGTGQQEKVNNKRQSLSFSLLSFALKHTLDD